MAIEVYLGKLYTNRLEEANSSLNKSIRYPLDHPLELLPSRKIPNKVTSCLSGVIHQSSFRTLSPLHGVYLRKT